MWLFQLELSAKKSTWKNALRHSFLLIKHMRILCPGIEQHNERSCPKTQWRNIRYHEKAQCPQRKISSVLCSTRLLQGSGTMNKVQKVINLPNWTVVIHFHCIWLSVVMLINQNCWNMEENCTEFFRYLLMRFLNLKWLLAFTVGLRREKDIRVLNWPYSMCADKPELL